MPPPLMDLRFPHPEILALRSLSFRSSSPSAISIAFPPPSSNPTFTPSDDAGNPVEFVLDPDGQALLLKVQAWEGEGLRLEFGLRVGEEWGGLVFVVAESSARLRELVESSELTNPQHPQINPVHLPPPVPAPDSLATWSWPFRPPPHSNRRTGFPTYCAFVDVSSPPRIMASFGFWVARSPSSARPHPSPAAPFSPSPLLSSPPDPPPDGPLFRATLSSLIGRSSNMRRSAKSAIKAASSLHSALLEAHAAQGALGSALREFGAQSPDVLGRLLGAEGAWGEEAWRKLGMIRREEAEQLRRLVIDPLRRFSDACKSSESSRKAFEDKSKSYYAHTSKYLSTLLPSSSSAKQARSDDKHHARNADFEHARFALLTELHDLHGGRGEFELLAGLAGWARWTTAFARASAEDLGVYRGGVEGLGLEIARRQEELDLLFAEREARRKEMEHAAAQCTSPSPSPRPDAEWDSQSPNPAYPASSTSPASEKEKESKGKRAEIGEKLKGIVSSSSSRFVFPLPQSRPSSNPTASTTSLTPTPTSAAAASVTAAPALPPRTSSHQQRHSLQLPPTSSTSNSTSSLAVPSTASVTSRAARKREGFLWASSRPGKEGAAGDGRAAGGAWHKYWVVLEKSQVFEFVGWRDAALELNQHPIDLRFATVREGRSGDRRFLFEVITLTSKRTYQAVSEASQKEWISAIASAIEACLNGTASIRFDAAKLRDASTTNDFAGRRSPSPLSSSSSSHFSHVLEGLGSSKPLVRRTSLNYHRRRESDLGQMTDKPQQYSHHHARSSLDFNAPSRTRELGTLSEAPSAWLQPPALAGPSLGLGLGLGGKSDSLASSDRSDSPTTAPPSSSGEGAPTATASEDADRRIADAVNGMAARSGFRSPPLLPRPPSSVRRGDEPEDKEANARRLRGVMGVPGEGNDRCADCRTADPRWASWCLDLVPLVIFICIRCSGLHRGLGTHISKVKSVDLDDWTAEQVDSAALWGNRRANLYWEARKPPDEVPNDSTIASFISSKYREKTWAAPGPPRLLDGPQHPPAGSAAGTPASSMRLHASRPASSMLRDFNTWRPSADAPPEPEGEGERARERQEPPTLVVGSAPGSGFLSGRWDGTHGRSRRSYVPGSPVV